MWNFLKLDYRVLNNGFSRLRKGKILFFQCEHNNNNNNNNNNNRDNYNNHVIMCDSVIEPSSPQR